MNRPWRILVIVGLCLAVVVAAMGWMTVRLLQLDRAESDALYEAALEESVRLSLWRMDSALAPIIARESARPHFVYDPFYPAFRARALLSIDASDNDTPLPSPLLTDVPPFVLLYFQIDGDGVVSSPQVPRNADDNTRAAELVPGDALTAWSGQLAELQGWLDTAAVGDALAHRAGESLLALHVPESSTTKTSYRPVTVQVAPPADDGVAAVAPSPAVQDRNINPSNMAQVERAEQLVQQGNEYNTQAAPAEVVGNRYSRGGGRRDAPVVQVAEPDPQVQAAPDAQQMLNAQEFVARANVGNETVVYQQSAVNYYMPSSELVTGFVIPLWVDDRLVLVRQVTVDGTARIQGCWLDWPPMEAWLIGEVDDLLPAARLEPVDPDAADQHGRLLASIPVRLVPGEIQAAPPAATPVQATLTVAWIAVAVAIVAVIGLVLGVVSLSERRAAFVSAVTHEMRTPLTTFRMYSEMLAEGMVGPEKRDRYLQTLQREADRLGHLVDNVLTYARLDGGRSSTRPGRIRAGEILDHVRPRLDDRAHQAGLELSLEADQASLDAEVRADLSAVEQIMLNLVDNACKYAAGAEDRRLTLRAVATARAWAITVRDRGPGITPGFRRKLFRPFSKSAEEAAESAPGVGLGMALSRRLAREMGGDLALDEAVNDGAAFVLTLPRA